MPVENWRETGLWEALGKSGGRSKGTIVSTLESHLPEIEEVLAKGATSPTDFSLHDERHAFRVAEWMLKIIPKRVLPELSPYEVALLLLSAYLHDIGMTPEQKTVGQHWHHLVFGKPPQADTAGLTDEEARLLQQWLDEEGRGIEAPMCPDGNASQEQIRLADELMTHYCRHRHNDWSERYIREKLGSIKLADYEHWLEDLVSLSRSHHEGYEDLRQDRFDPRPVDSADSVVHLRYLACVLRVADILDVDPERTPEVIFAHRDIGAGSVLYWRKDHMTWLTRDKGQLVVTARPDRAYMEKAIRDTADTIEVELRTCDRLNRERPFTHAAFRTAEPLPHEWEFPAVVNVQVQPKEGTYIYIDGAFRPNTRKLLELLGGRELYGDRAVAIRELLQNAFDAVREEIALERLKQPDPADREWETILGKQHHVQLRFEQRDGRWWLVCSDDGVGMTQGIIRDHVLVSGNPRQRHVRELERKCDAAGFRLGRTAQFGIGVLSYFMLADRVEVRTRRSQSYAGPPETSGWYFETEGVGSFGELRPDDDAKPGAEVRLRLSDLGEHTAQEWYSGLSSYLFNTLRYLPCRLALTSPVQGCDDRAWPPGWFLSPDILGNHLVGAFQAESSGRTPPTELLPSAKRLEIEAAEQELGQARKEARACLRWYTEEGELPDNLGRFRVLVPYFELPRGNCAGFMRAAEKGGSIVILRAGKRELFVPESEHLWAWYGASVPARLREKHGSYRIYQDRHVLEINWENSAAGEVRINRAEVDLTPAARSAHKWAGKQGRDIESQLFGQWPNTYAELNLRICHNLELPRYERCWKLGRDPTAGEGIWGPIPFPVVDASVLDRDLRTPEIKSLRWRGRTVRTLLPLSARPSDQGRWVPAPSPPDRIVSLMPDLVRVTGLWERAEQPPAAKCPLGLTSSFPRPWPHVCAFGYRYPHQTFWNPANSAVQAVDHEAFEWWRAQCAEDPWEKRQPDPCSIKDEILASGGRAAIWLLHVLEEKEQDVYLGALERDPEFILALWRLLYPQAERENSAAPPVIAMWFQERFESELCTVSPSEFRRLKALDEITKLLPDPGAEWRLEIVKA